MRRANMSTFLTGRPDIGEVYRIFIRDLEVEWTGEPQDATRTLRADIELIAGRPQPINADRYRKVVCYDTVVKAAKALAAMPEFTCLDELADRIAARCFDDGRVRSVRVRLRPAEAGDTGDGGVETVRDRPAHAA